MKVTRNPDNPIITPAHSASIGTNINGPSVIRVPDWVEDPLGRYYLYFAHHKGKGIRLAYADAADGPYTVYEPGVLSLAESLFPTEITAEQLRPETRQRLREMGVGAEALYTHIASPDVLVVPEVREIRLYYHGMLEGGGQASRVAVSHEGLNFTAQPEIISNPYLRMFRWEDLYYGMAMPGVFYRSENGLVKFEKGPTLFNKDMRHAALLIRDDLLHVFWTQVGHEPERILLSVIDISNDWMRWKESEATVVLCPEMEWEGASLPLVPSVRGAIEVPVNQLRDPCIFEEDGKICLLYSVAGESGIATARLEL